MLCLADDISKKNINDLLEQSGSMLNTRRAHDYSLFGTKSTVPVFSRTTCIC